MAFVLILFLIRAKSKSYLMAFVLLLFLIRVGNDKCHVIFRCLHDIRLGPQGSKRKDLPALVKIFPPIDQFIASDVLK